MWPNPCSRRLGADVPGPKSGVHGLACLVREGTACTKVELQSQVRICRWYDVGSRAQVPYVDLLAGLRLPALRRLLGCLPVWVRLALGSCWLPAVCVGPVSSPSGEGVEFVLCGLLFLVLAVVERVLLARWGFSRSWLFSLVHPGLRRSSRSFCIWAVSRHFFVLRGTR